MSKVLVSGSIAYDRIMDYEGNFTDHVVPGKLHSLSVSFQVPSVVENFGGCGGNIAYNLALLGESPDVVMVAGSDFARYKTYFEKLGIDTASIRIDESKLTSAAHIMTDKADNQIAAFAMAAGGKRYGEFPATAAYRCAMLSAGNIPDTVALAAHCKKNGLPYYFDPAQALTGFDNAELKTVVEGAAGLFGNDYEMGLIEQKTGWGERMLAEVVPFVVITLGEKGSKVLSNGETIEVSAVPVKEVVDPTGAGDSHRAGFIKGIASGLTLLQCARLANTVAAYVIETFGTQNHHFTISELKERYRRAYGEPLTLGGIMR